MNFKKMMLSAAIVSMVFMAKMQAQNAVKDSEKENKVNLNPSGSNYLKISGLVQVWAREMEYNPGSNIFGYPKSSGADIGIRRFRVVMMGQITDRIFFFSQFGQNNINAVSDRKLGFFVHDAWGEYSLHKTKLSMGAGLSVWNGLSRFSSSSGARAVGIDSPLFLNTTVDVID